MNRSVVRLLLVAALSTAIPAALADHCSGWRSSTPDAKAGGYYLDADVCQRQCIYSVWVYEEANGIVGLQREDTTVNDTCHGMIPGDRIVV